MDDCRMIIMDWQVNDNTGLTDDNRMIIDNNDNR